MICFDTHVLIWGVQGVASKGQEHLVAKARKYIRHLDAKHERIMVPAPVVGEYLIGFNDKDRHAQQELLQRLFFVPALDMHAATVQAEIEGNQELLKELRDRFRLGRQEIRVDAQILAVAIVNNADRVISYDPHMPILAQGRVAVQELPDVHEQMDLSF
jgi:predicted nucleic acid-binding protein